MFLPLPRRFYTPIASSLHHYCLYLPHLTAAMLALNLILEQHATAEDFGVNISEDAVNKLPVND